MDKLFAGFKGSKWIQIRYTNKGAYFTKHGKRYYLSEFMRYGLYGFLQLNNFGGMVIKLDENNESVKVSYNFTA